jgi:hypothetical protein
MLAVWPYAYTAIGTAGSSRNRLGPVGLNSKGDLSYLAKCGFVVHE